MMKALCTNLIHDFLKKFSLSMHESVLMCWNHDSHRFISYLNEFTNLNQGIPEEPGENELFGIAI